MTSRCPACWTGWASPLADGLVTGAAVYRVPVDDTALVFQVGQPAERPADPERAARIRHVDQAPPGSTLTLRRRRDLRGGHRVLSRGVRPLPGRRSRGIAAAVPGAGRPGRRGGRGPGRRAAGPGGLRRRAWAVFVHRWTARTLAALCPGATRHAHQRAAAFWRWRVASLRKAAKTLSTSSWKPATTITPPGRTTRR